MEIIKDLYHKNELLTVMKSASDLAMRKVSDLGSIVKLGHGVVFEESYLSKSYDEKFETALNILRVDDETRKKYLKSLKNLDREIFVQERLALIGTVKEEMERLTDDIIHNKREELSPLDDRKIFIKMGSCFMYQTITPNRFPIEDYERESLDMLVFGLHGVKSSHLVSRINDDEYDAVVSYDGHPRKAVIGTEELRGTGLKYTSTEDRTGIIFNSSELPEEKNLRDSINKENSAH